ncbi:sensor histidine kinase [Paenarthrobacter nicotinovorans]|uniref:sensor histidine kinase n=1 Tax=Paenarthrobacter nicotinovorans TaxID=29320 RepID=UPI00166C2377|nr:HAMP domain-containing sensor histidine kinase [Paenarthrobacter nicotinovorans]UKF00356.1 HAMP domain-containing histidine kinase [Paenarthrobacter nicotinovorans]UKF05137.1 HAMP domain-containing histidine kinase [Paenarthrobacter nicotinovorans]GGV32103.1 sensor protein CutS [Paenarthrobacter nicotinovorans]
MPVRPASRSRRRRLTIRTRFALTYAGLSIATGTLMLTMIYLFMRYVPNYDFAVFDGKTLQVGPSIPLDGGNSVTSGAAAPFLISSTEALFNVLLATSAVVLLILIAAGIATGWWIAGRMVSPLLAINAAALRAATGTLDQRVNLLGPRDEISDLAAAFDHMLDRLQHSLTMTSRFAANASHELRTPLATNRAMLDAAVARVTDPAELSLLGRLRLTNERSITIVEALLDLAEIEATSAPLTPTELSTATHEALASCADEARSRGVAIELHLDPVVIYANQALLVQLISNLLQNAIRHNEPGGFVQVSVAASTADTVPRLEILNSGPVVDEQTLAKLTEPFTRAEGRTRSTGSGSTGRGLGLSIVSAIAVRLDADLDLKVRPEGGLRATVFFPLTT